MQNRKKIHYQPTQADYERFNRAANDPFLINRKCKYEITFQHNRIKALLCKIIYGKDDAIIKEKIKQDDDFFKEFGWKLVKTTNLKQNEDKV